MSSQRSTSTSPVLTTLEPPEAGPSTVAIPVYIPPKPRTPKTPPKPILKRPPPTPQNFFSFTKNILSISAKFLPPNAQPVVNGSATPTPLKRAHFIVPEISTIYPISSQAPPSTPGLSDAIKDIEDKEAERRIHNRDDCNWSLDRVEEFYTECCKLRDETPYPSIVRAIRVFI